MDIKKIIVMEYVKGERVYQMSMPADAPLSELYEAFYDGLSQTVNMIKENAEKLKPQELVEEKGDDEQKSKK